tara:strand:+ start:11576 stop:12076 length:501 start_codon:yes stop_codon:yes gene_type:complete
MAVETLYGSKVMTLVANSTPSKFAPVGLLGGRIRYANDTVEVTAAASVASTYDLARLPANARIITNMSLLHWDDLGTTTSTLTVGLYGVDDATNDDSDIIGTGLNPTSAGSGAVGPIGIANYGKTIWELLGFSADPGGMFDVRVTVVAGVQSVGGTLALEMAYTVD